MTLEQQFRRIYLQHFLLATTASIILLGFIGSVNVLVVTARPFTLGGFFALLLTVVATMRFLAFFLAQYPPQRVYLSFLTGMIVQAIVFVLLWMN